MPDREDAIALDRDALTPIVRDLVGSTTAEIDELAVEQLWGMGLVGAVHRIHGTATFDGQSKPWSVIRKHVADTGSAENDLRYWKREALVYSSGILDGIAGVSAPRCFAQVEDADGIELWLEAVPAPDAPWTLDDWQRVAVALAEMAAPFASGAPSPDRPWLSRCWLETWVEQAAPGFARFDDAVRDPWLARLFPPPVASIAKSLWERRQDLCAQLRAPAAVFGHLDTVPVNVRIDGDRVVLLDWAFAGHAALGEDLASLVGASSLFGGPQASELADVDDVTFPAYVDGLRAAGWKGDNATVRFAYCAATALRYCVGVSAFYLSGIGPTGDVIDVGGLRNADQRAFFESSFERSLDEIIEAVAANFAFLTLTLGREALQLLRDG